MMDEHKLLLESNLTALAAVQGAHHWQSW